MEKTKTRPWDPAEHLETDEGMAAHLNVALEEPQILAQDIREFFRPLRDV